MERRPPRRRELTSDEQEALRAAFFRFKEETGISVGRLLRTAGGHSSDISPSHVARRIGPLAGAFTYPELPSLAGELGMNFEQYQALERLAVAVQSVFSGLPFPPEALLGSAQEALQAGELGEYFWFHDWRKSPAFLAPAWQVFGRDLPHFLQQNVRPVLRAGTVWMDWLTYQARFTEAARVANLLRQARPRLDPDDPADLYAWGLFLRGAAVLDRHQGLRAPRLAIGLEEQALEYLRAADREPLSEIAVLRDEAKCYLWAGLGTRFNPPDQDLLNRALTLLDEADTRTGGTPPDEDKREEWVYNQLARLTVQSLRGEADAARATWETMQDQWWLSEFLREREDTTLPAAIEFDRLALDYGGDPKALKEAARRYAANPRYRDLLDRCRRAREIERGAEQRDLRLIQHGFTH